MNGEHHHVIPARASRGSVAMTCDELEAWGRAFGAAAAAPLVVTIAGELGAGKTTLVQSICAGFGVTAEVTSPTFALVHEYAGSRGNVYHLDLYRLTSPADLTNIGWDEITSAHALVLVEWPERAGDRLPKHTVPLDLEYVPGDDSRRILFAG